MTTAPPVVRHFEANARSMDEFGRVLCVARSHHLVVDGPTYNGCPGEAITPGELFLSAVAACGVELIEVIAKELGVAVTSVEVEIEGRVDPANPVRSDLTVFNWVRLRVTVGGVSEEQASDLVARFQRRCPLYGSVAASAADVQVEVATAA